MSFLAILGLAFAALTGALTALLMKVYRARPYLEEEPTMPLEAPKTLPEAPLPIKPPSMPKLDFSTPKAAYHSTRVLCDEMGLTLEEKNTICACIFQESRFDNRAIGKNKKSTDWGIVQVNDFWHIGKGKQFPSVEYVVANPETCVRWMINCLIQKNLEMWASYKSGAYKQWLSTSSPMWALAK